MNVPAPHARLLADVGAAGLSHPLALAGGHALEAHGLIERPHANVDLATEGPEPMEEVAAAVERALTDRGHEVAVRSLTPLSAQLTVTDPETGRRASCPSTRRPCGTRSPTATSGRYWPWRTRWAPRSGPCTTGAPPST